MTAVIRASWTLTVNISTKAPMKVMTAMKSILRAVVGDLADLLQILGHAADEVPGLLVVVEAEGELLQMVEALRRISVSMLMPSMWPQ